MKSRTRASDNHLHFIVLTPERTLLALDTVAKVRVKLADGMWLSIYPKHAPLVAKTQCGTLHYVADPVTKTYQDQQDAHESTLDLAEGILYVSRNVVTLFTSGLAEATPPAQLPEDDKEALHFDRLAGALLSALNAKPDSVLAIEPES